LQDLLSANFHSAFASAIAMGRDESGSVIAAKFLPWLAVVAASGEWQAYRDDSPTARVYRVIAARTSTSSMPLLVVAGPPVQPVAIPTRP
jgi:hypothetical protein